MTIKQKIFTMLVASAVISGNAIAQTTESGMSLKQCLEFALKSNYLIKQAKYDEAIALAKTKEMIAGALPQINAGATLTNNISLPVIMLPGELIGKPNVNVPVEFGSPYEAGANIELSQIVFNPTLFAGIKTSKNAEELTVLKSQLTSEELIYNVSIAFYDILYSELELISVVSNLNMQDSLYYRTAYRVQQELTREIDLNRIKVGIINLKVQREQLAATIEQQKRFLKILIGIPLDMTLILSNSCLHEMDAPNDLLNESLYLLGRTELTLLEKQKSLSQMNIKQINSQYLPSLSFVASGGYQFQSEKFKLSQSESWFSQSLIGLRLSVPIFDGLSKQKQVRQMNLTIRKLDEEINFTKQSIQVQHENARQELAISYKSVNAQQENLLLTEKIYEQSRALYKEGLYNVTDLLQTELTLRETQTAYWSEVIKYKKAHLNLMKAGGTLDNLLK